MDIQKALRDFAMKISGTSVVDNEANPASAVNMMKRKKAATPVQQKQGPYMPQTYGPNAKQKVYGVPNAK